MMAAFGRLCEILRRVMGRSQRKYVRRTREKDGKSSERAEMVYRRIIRPQNFNHAQSILFIRAFHSK